MVSWTMSLPRKGAVSLVTVQILPAVGTTSIMHYVNTSGYTSELEITGDHQPSSVQFSHMRPNTYPTMMAAQKDRLLDSLSINLPCA